MYPCSWAPRRTAFDGRTLRFLLAALVFSRSPTDLPMAGGIPAARCAPASLRIVRLLVVDRAGVAPRVLAAATGESTAIWAQAGVRLEWMLPPLAFDRMDGDTVVVVIRSAFVGPPTPRLPQPWGAAHGALGRVHFGVDDRPANMIEVSFDAIASLVLEGSQFDRPIVRLPVANQTAFIGRGLGRVVAHELGHWLAGRGHAPSGVMKARFAASDLVASLVPLLPSAWRSLLGGAARARSPRCEADAGAEVRGELAAR